MRTFRELKKVFLGEIIAAMLLLPYAVCANGDFGISLVTFIERYLADVETIFAVLGYGVFVLLMTYTIYTLYKAIERDVMEIKYHFTKKHKETNN
ncbi:MAG: hypothetical protein J6Y02_11315 [Pseudobutyrivibrio sp.]|nr:hypothetical protein [Pseudobutyrivibrio sp.]